MKMQAKREQVHKFLNQTIQHYGLQNIENMDYELGIDQAGRGPVFGTMVYSALWWPVEFKEKLASLGFDDSKQLTEQQRQQLLELLDILRGKIIFYQIREITATQISTNMQNLKHNINLNEMSHNAALELSRRAFNQGFKIVHIYADTVGDAGKYATFLTNNLNQHLQILKQVTVQPKADSKFKVVSASSICAKVNRDRIISQWKFVQNLPFKGVLGSGYPGDPKTKQWLVDNKHPIFGYPNIVRFSWSTAVNNLKGTLKMNIIQDQKYQNKLKKLNYLDQYRNQLNRDLWDILAQ